MTIPIISYEKVDKHVYLSKAAVDKIEAYIVKNGLNPKKDFSKTLEALALITLQDEVMLGHVQAIQQAVEGAVAAQYNRFAKLLGHIAIEVGAARDSAQYVLFRQLVDEKKAYEMAMEETTLPMPTLEEFEYSLGLRRNVELDEIVIAVYEKRLDQFDHQSAKRLKKPFETILELITSVDDEKNDG